MFTDANFAILITITGLNWILYHISVKYMLNQGCNARKVISEVYASFVLQCTVSGR